jgi:RNA polymerase sigma factor (sigma-70 family)
LDNSRESVNSLVSHLFRHEAGKLVAILTRIFGPGNIQLAEDIVQDTLIAAMDSWTGHDLPDNPAAWLMQVAKRKALNELRRTKVVYRHCEASGDENGDYVAWVEGIFLDKEIQDSQLRMIFTCCHPSLSMKSQTALTLKVLCGFSIKEVSQALLTSEDVIHKRLYRSKEKIRSQKIPFNIPSRDKLTGRIDAVCLTLYLLFNEGYNSSSSEKIIRKDLCAEALRLTILLNQYFSDRSETCALISLMCLHAARFEARLDRQGAIVIFEDQDRTLWNRELIAKGLHYLKKASASARLSEYHLEAGIAAEHCLAKSFEETDWQSIYSQYELLYRLKQNPIIKLNMAIICSQLESTLAAIQKLEKLILEKELDGYYLLHATLGIFYLKEKQYNRALRYLTRAKNMTNSSQETEFLNKRLSECRSRL